MVTASFFVLIKVVLMTKILRQKRYSGQRETAPKNLPQQNENQSNKRRQSLNEKYFLRS